MTRRARTTGIRDRPISPGSSVGVKTAEDRLRYDDAEALNRARLAETTPAGARNGFGEPRDRKPKSRLSRPRLAAETACPAFEPAKMPECIAVAPAQPRALWCTPQGDIELMQKSDCGRLALSRAGRVDCLRLTASSSSSNDFEIGSRTYLKIV